MTFTYGCDYKMANRSAMQPINMSKWLIIGGQEEDKILWCHTGIFASLHGVQAKGTTAP